MWSRINKDVLFVFALFLLFTSCKEDEALYELIFETSFIEITQGEIATVEIKSGNGGYVLNLSSEDIVEAQVQDNVVVLNAKNTGQVMVTVKDRAGKSVVLEVYVSAAGGDISSYFSWDTIRIKLDEANDWGLSFFQERVTITNVTGKRHYLLSWKEGWAVGVKTNGVLKIVEDGEITQTISLTRLSIVDLHNDYYSILFNKNNQTGQILFAK